MDPATIEMIGVGLFAASEIIALSPLRSNSIIQIVLEVMMKVFPRK